MELVVVLVIFGVLAAFAVPRFQISVERAKASEAFHYASALHSAQELYHSSHGAYASSLSQLDMTLDTPADFSLGTIVVPASETSLETGWELTFTRTGASGGDDAYTLVWGHLGYDETHSTISIAVSPFQTVSN